MSLNNLENKHRHPVPPDVIRESEFFSRRLILVYRANFHPVFLHSARSRNQALLLSLVCKEAYAWIVRVIYRSVTFTTHVDLVKFQNTISNHPELAGYIHSLYIGSTQHEKYPEAQTRSHSRIKYDRPPRKLTWNHSTLVIVQELLSHSRNIERLALINLPPSNWSAIEGRLPARLKTLAIGPSYGLLGLNVAHRGLERFYYADTILQSSELARIASLPSLTDFRWKSPLRFDDVVYGQLKLLLQSISLQTLHITLFGTETEMLSLYKTEYDDLLQDGRITIVCDPTYEESREWIKDFHEQWHAVEV
ncbi:hypothetical protein Clacol_009210 [Clathrus columnatus]|uniref:Uncharacterized protein n=1 Tax=Clathrus columnatus TaxID=1419009 RepID=A0AAV5AKJ9_9AGAM|nr:hypothetical protein Clacol_009210 [Clathrus columnatus]